MSVADLANVAGAPEPEMLHSQALIVTAGPFKGRIGNNDDDEFIFRSDLTAAELRWMKRAGVVWRELELTPEDVGDDDDEFTDTIGVDCEVVTFGFYMECDGYHFIPRQFLQPATMKNLIQRHQEISQLLVDAALARRGPAKSLRRRTDLLLEQAYIVDEIWRREALARDNSAPRKVFLCHASADKPFVRQVRNDLAAAGHSVWIDEFEIKVGDSIVAKISEATEMADALILFISKSSMESEWVNREWNSSLARMLSGASVRVLPVVIEDCSRPPLLADIKYADFRQSYNAGLGELLTALKGLESQERKH
jgi:hypothetical protein